MFNRSTACLIVCAMLVAVPQAASAAGDSCADYLVIGARGSEQPFEPSTEGMGPDVFQFAVAMDDLLTSEGSTVDRVGVTYPALAIGAGVAIESISGLQGERLASYRDSVEEGAEEVDRLVRETMSRCQGATKFIMAGYSQGSDAIRRGLDQLGSPSSQGMELGQVAGVAVLGDPFFNPRDLSAAAGSYNPSRTGLLGPLGFWSDSTDAPVVSMCREGDFFCQYRKYSTVTGDSGDTAQVPTGDVQPVLTWAEKRHGWSPLEPVTDVANRSKIFSEHGMYGASGQGRDAAYLLADEMGFADAGPLDYGAAPVDVALLIDSTGAADGAVAELQRRAEEFAAVVLDNAQNSRIAVVDYKAAAITEANPYRVKVSGFSSDLDDAVDAITSIEQGGGDHGVIYSAVKAVNELPWRPEARKVTLTLSGSRACPSQSCDFDEAGVAYPQYHGPNATGIQPTNLRRAGLYTQDDENSSERTDWSAAIDAAYTSLPGAHGITPELTVDELKRIFVNALTRADDPIAHTETAVTWQTGYFNAGSLAPFYASSAPPRFQWTTSWSPLPSEDAGGITPSAMAVLGADPEPESEFSDEGALYEVQFDRPGIYEVTLTALVDGETREWTTSVRVDAIPTDAPASPLLTSFVEDGTQVLAWTPGAGTPATAYVVVDAAGGVVDTVIPVADHGQNGVLDFEYPIELRDDEDSTYSVRAMNASYVNTATPLVTASEASYEHASAIGGIPSGRTLRLSGDSTPDLDAIRARSALGLPAPSIFNRSFEVHFVSPSGARFDVDQARLSVDAQLGEDGWTLEIPLEDAMDTKGTPAWETMRDGFADELLAGGYVELFVDGYVVRVRIDPTAETEQPGQYVIDADSPPPAGATVTGTSAIPGDESLSLEYRGEIDPGLLPALSEVDDPDYDWSTASISDVHTWIGSSEVMNDAVLAIQSGSFGNSAADGDFVLELTGAVAGGGYQAMRNFLQTGTISFKVNGGLPNTLSLRETTESATNAFPAPSSPPTFVGSVTARFTQYRDDATWKPVINWGSELPGTIFIDGVLPLGLRSDWETGRIEGTPTQQGSFPLSITATSDAGQSTREYTLVVGPNGIYNQYDPPTYDTRVDRNPDGSLIVSLRRTDYLRSDNLNLGSTLPLIEQAEAGSGYLEDVVDDVVADRGGTRMSFTGTFTVRLQRGSGTSPDSFELSSSNAGFGDNSYAIVRNLLGEGTWLTFTDSYGGINTVAIGKFDLRLTAEEL